jgi:hypothetical protein
MTQTLEIRQLDAIVAQLDDVRDSLPRISVAPSVKIKALAKAISDLDDLRELLSMPRVGCPRSTQPPALRNERSAENLILSLGGAILLATIGVQVGIHHGRATCPAPNLARVGP